jgi:mono/diheme cytochrome c family protein
MRHFIANVATYAIAALLLLGAGSFAWLRSAQVVFTVEPVVLARWEPAPGQGFAWEALGESTYVRNCANCHGDEGGGWDQYPPLDGAAALFLVPGGREHLVDLHLYGLASPRWRAPMPPMGHLEDVEVAAVVNYVLTRFGGPLPPETALVRPEEVAARRGLGLRPRDVERARPRQGATRSPGGPGRGGA